MSESLLQNYAGVFDGRIGFGKRAAILVIDFIRAYTTPGAPLYAAPVVEAVRETVDVLAAARRKGVLVVYTRVIYSPSGIDGGIFVQKVPVLRTMVEGEPLAEIVPELPPAATDVILNKQYASAFFGTSLAAMLTAQGVDTVIITGCSTSGCVRATAVDGMQYGFRVIVPRECVGDRRVEPHEANLFDINSKYGDVVSRAETLAWLEALPSSP
ncbi:MAG TPA: N-carbamoylsarcosine amidohydrolase [Thermoflexales bacterium]|nr:N-carbamoylsarcosine amidohydrolase [Thermoflexales bacterium]HQX09649.1 N-carbamoylsarcosine amidohydrolase [Thermoflexales bacterium]HQY26495.1 N-carbamoylsarcosine amidohydrolase [Thermoflexales bacterium]HQZ52125.1 N-carbamoylsarcosine amidohydrolase [Thermoflexales bacterium]HRA53208.1 N-carbamoylsarcosine amidohydrolase [Thermoflexales bacterium]